tara:strand:+ start:33 stop:704 length:672 start_codon:yes stop_codon:yes gene_type:complete
MRERYEGLVNNYDKYTYHILGCGAIGSAAATQLVRMGANNLVLYDMDTVGTENIGVSQYTREDLNKLKVEALREQLKKINPDCAVNTFNNRFNANDWRPRNSATNDVVVLGFDSMASRKEAMEIILHSDRPAFVIDGRMGAEHYHQVVLASPTLNAYIKHWYSDEQGDPEPCNAKATSYCSNMSGSIISDTIKKLLTNSVYYKELSFHFPSLTMRRSGVVDNQ